MRAAYFCFSSSVSPGTLMNVPVDCSPAMTSAAFCSGCAVSIRYVATIRSLLIELSFRGSIEPIRSTHRHDSAALRGLIRGEHQSHRLQVVLASGLCRRLAAQARQQVGVAGHDAGVDDV